jgi:hypothetical protein
MPKVLFYVERDLHLPFLLPVLDELRNYPDLEFGFSAPSYLPSSTQKPGRGLASKDIQKLKQRAAFFEDPKDFNPDVTVIADACQFLLPYHTGPTVNVGHGLICKGTFYSPSPSSRRENLSSALCVPGPWHKKRLQNQVDIPVKVTGFIKTDQLIQGHLPDRKTFNRKNQLPTEAYNIIYAPTFNPELSSLPWVLPHLEKLTSKETNLLLKLHNMTPPQWVEACQKIANSNQRIALLHDSEYNATLQHADLMISDVSSIFVEFMLLDKPVVLFQPPDIKNFDKFDSGDIEYQVKTAASEVKNPAELKQEVQEKLEHPEKGSEQRKSYRQLLDYKRDGKSAKRTAQTVLETIEQQAKPKLKSKDKFLVLLDAQESDQAEIEKSLQEIHLAGCEQDMEIYCLCGKSPKSNSFSVLNLDINTLYTKLFQNKADYVVLLKAGCHLPYNWAKHMALHTFWEQDVGIVRALAQRGVADSILEHFEFNKAHLMPDCISAHYLRTVGIGSNGLGICGPTYCLLSSTKLIQEALQDGCPGSITELSNRLHKQTEDIGKQILTALDILVYPFNSSRRSAALY